jgi:hypothetical protein
MFEHEGVMCCSTCFVEMHDFIVDEHGNPIAYICSNCAKITDLTDKL